MGKASTRRLTIVELQKMTWDNRDAMEKDFKRASVPLTGADYATGVDGHGKWQVVDRTDWPVTTTKDPDEFIQKPVNGNTANVVPIKKAAAKKGYNGGKVTNGPGSDDHKAAEAMRKQAETAPKKAAAPPKKAAAKKAAGDEPKGGPDVGKLPRGFAEWAIDLAKGADGLLRVDLAKKADQSCKWQHYLRDIAKAAGLTMTMERDGRYTRFRMKKA